MSSETGVEPALLIALNDAPETQSDAVAALSDILEGPPTTSEDAKQEPTASEVQEAEKGLEKTEQRKSPVQQTEADEKRHKRPRITYTPERDSHNKRRRSRSRSYERERYRRRSVDSRYRRRSRSRSRSPRRYRNERRSTPARLQRADLKIEDLLEGKYPLIPAPKGVNLRFEKEDLAEIPFGGGLKNPPPPPPPEAIDPPEASTMQTFAGFTRFQTLNLAKEYPKPPTALAQDGSALTLFFTNKYIFSNHYHCKILIDGAFFICTEQYYMYQKARYFGDLDIAHLILAAKDPKEMKRLGRQVNGFEKSSWDTVSVQVMKTALFHKFVQNDTLRRELFKTVGTTLVEASPMDHYWGVGLSIDNDAIRDPAQWKGQNLLGHLLTTLREHLMIRPEYADEVKEITAELKAAA